jgi:hypothetical protein
MKIIISRINILIHNMMLISCLVLLYASCQKVPSQENIYGFWEGNFRGKELMFEFTSDKTCVMSITDKASGTVEMLNGSFEMDFSKKPISLSIRNIPQLDHPLHTIVEFIGSDSISLAYFAPKERFRPVAFTRSTNLDLKRVG